MRKSKVIYIGNEKTYFATSASFGIIPGNSLVHGQKKCPSIIFTSPWSSSCVMEYQVNFNTNRYWFERKFVWKWSRKSKALYCCSSFPSHHCVLISCCSSFLSHHCVLISCCSSFPSHHCDLISSSTLCNSREYFPSENCNILMRFNSGNFHIVSHRSTNWAKGDLHKRNLQRWLLTY